MDISIVIPLFNEDESLPHLYEWLKKVLTANNFSHEILFVDDGSKDNSWQIVQDLAAKDETVKGISFRRNYGKSAALHEGFGVVTGNVVITMDADLQDSPDEIPELYKMITEDGFDLVSGWKKKRYDPITKTIPSKLYNGTTSWLSGIKLHDMNCGLKAYKRDVIKSVEIYGEMHRYIPVMAKQAGFDNIGEKVVEHRAREFGVTKFGLERFVFGFLDLLSIMFVTRYGKRPMHLFGTVGILSFLIGGIVAVALPLQKLYNIAFDLPVRDVVDQPLFFMSLVLVIVGSQLFLTGFLAELISRSGADRNDYQVKERI